MAPKKAAAKDKDAPKKVCTPARYCMRNPIKQKLIWALRASCLAQEVAFVITQTG